MKLRLPGRRWLVWGILGLLALVVLTLAFRSPAVLVDSAVVQRGELRVTVTEEGRTRVVDRYEVTAPISGYLNRIPLVPGDAVAQGDVLVAINAPPLDPRSRAQAEAALQRAQAALEAARTEVEAAEARTELATAELQRTQSMVQDGFVPSELFDRASAEARQANATLRSAQFAVDVAFHERESAWAVLAITGNQAQPVQVNAPTDGMVLQRWRESEGAIQMGEPLLVMGNTAGLEVEVDLLSSDAVRVRPGMRVEIDRWGGDDILAGEVKRVEPSGFTHTSALGVEEQRVWVIVDLVTEPEARENLGHGYRVEARFILWEGDDVLQVPSSALFREGNEWAAFVVVNGEAARRSVVPGRRSGLMVEVVEGLSEGEVVVLHPGEDLEEGIDVEVRE